MYERHHQPLLPPRAFKRRLVRNIGLAGALLVASLTLGTAGYHFFGQLEWLDAEVNAAMILTGMGPVNPMQTVGGKIFTSAYALFSGVTFLTAISVVLAPLLHRFLHRFHLADERGR